MEAFTIDRTEIDGVTVLSIPTAPRPFAAMMFRVGRGDEPFRHLGITHLVEHLAFHGAGEQSFGVNGSVDHLMTTVVSGGRAAENAGFLTRITSTLREPPTDRLRHETNVLRAEAANRPNFSVPSGLMELRYGATGVGRYQMPEYALWTAEADDVRRWAGDWFTAGNAVAVFAGGVPDGTSFNLRSGPARPPAPRSPIAPLPLPAWMPWGIDGVAMGTVVPRTTPAAAALRLLRTRLERRLRHREAVSYEVSLAYLPLDAEEAHASIFASCERASADRLRVYLLTEVDRFRSTGPTKEELAEDLDGFLRKKEDPNAPLEALLRAATRTVLGAEPEPPDQLEEELRALQPAEVAEAMTAAWSGTLMAGPLDTTGTLHPYPRFSTTAIDGRRSWRKGSRPWSRSPESLVMSDEGIMVEDQRGPRSTVRFADAVGLIAEAGDVRTVVGADGFRVRVVAAEWEQGPWAVAHLDRLIPDDRKVDLTNVR